MALEKPGPHHHDVTKISQNFVNMTSPKEAGIPAIHLEIVCKQEGMQLSLTVKVNYV